MSIRYTVEDIRHTDYERYGLILLSESYHGNTDRLEWKQEATGVVFQKSWSGLMRNPNPQKKRLDTYEAVKAFIESYKGLGYVYSQTEYNNLGLSDGKNKALTISHPDLDEDWVATLSNFKRNVGKVSYR